MFPISKATKRQARDADGGAKHRADRQRNGEPKHVVSAIESANAGGDFLDEPHADESFERVARGDSERRPDVPRGQNVDEKCADENAGPKPGAEEEQGRDCDSGRRPNRRGAGV